MNNSTIHQLYQQYYGGREKVVMPLLNDQGKGKCVKCGRRRKLGVRGVGKGQCKKCRKINQ